MRLPSGLVGFVSKAWTEVVADASDPSAGSPFTIHFLDVGVGDAAIIDVGDREIIIDGGNWPTVLTGYAKATGVIDGPIELVIVTHGDQDHWKGIERLLGFDGVEDHPFRVLEYWDPGYDRDCDSPSSGGRQNYLAFVQKMRTAVPPGAFHRPLAARHPPAVDSGQLQPFTLPSVPGVQVTVLHADADPEGPDCVHRVSSKKPGVV